MIQGNRRWQYYYNEYGDRKQTISPEGKKTSYKYNQDGQLRGITQSLIGMLYDNSGRECEHFQDNGRVNRYQYDPIGQLIYPGGGSQLQILLTRDEINKLITSVGKPKVIN
ncbi:hypothetical protein [Gilliamella sp. Pas-s25]|uniref:hypothetical protein n=1 Tax=Gilliamella sp. Pas-s25 TaxID=2687310 RepID=UPI00135DEEF6|nr:hypothetical protein [Gilliamella sp. Pas-s25]MWP62527.1 hypothetical protein [Gilliamella sp. Pas-s25]